MDCSQTEWLNNKDFLRNFNRKALQMRIPVSGSLALTHRCNLRCVHCYLETEGQHSRGHSEMTTEELNSVVDEITDAGCLNLLITGGEPLLRRDFNVIYHHARSKGLLVTIFTNGTLITDEVLNLFDDLPPQEVEMTLYGATVGTYERITGIKGSYKLCLSGIERLLNHNINVGLKTVLMTHNRHEFYEIRDMAKAYGVRFRFDAAIFPRLNGDKTPLMMRVSPQEAIEKEFMESDRVDQWENLLGRFGELPATDTLYQCGAGMTAFHIDPYGNLQPCLMETSLHYNILNGSFAEGWRDVMPRIRERKADAAYVCNKCGKKLLCGFCPAFSRLETGSENLRSEYLCAMGHLRFRAVNKCALTGG